MATLYRNLFRFAITLVGLLLLGGGMAAGTAGAAAPAPGANGAANAAQAAVPMATPCGPAWSVVPSPNWDIYGNDLASVAVVNSNDIWAVGSYVPPYIGGDYQTLIEHGTTAWNVLASPNPSVVFSLLLDVAAISSNDAWAVGTYDDGNQQALIARWNGTAWSQFPGALYGAAVQLNSVAVVNSNDVWAVGTSPAPRRISNAGTARPGPSSPAPIRAPTPTSSGAWRWSTAVISGPSATPTAASATTR